LLWQQLLLFTAFYLFCCTNDKAALCCQSSDTINKLKTILGRVLPEFLREREGERESGRGRGREGKLLLMPTSVFPSSYFILAALFPVAVLHIYPVSDTFFVPMFAVCMSLFIQCPSRSTSNSPPAQQHVMLPSSSYEIQSNNCIHVYCPPFSSLATSSVKNVEIDFLFCCFAVNFPFFTQLCH